MVEIEYCIRPSTITSTAFLQAEKNRASRFGRRAEGPGAAKRRMRIPAVTRRRSRQQRGWNHWAALKQRTHESQGKHHFKLWLYRRLVRVASARGMGNLGRSSAESASSGHGHIVLRPRTNSRCPALPCCCQRRQWVSRSAQRKLLPVPSRLNPSVRLMETVGAS